MDDLPLLRAVALGLRAGRRRLGMNQREFARFAGLSASTVARLEASRDDVGLRSLRQALAMVGLRLAVVHDDGAPFTESSALPFDDLGVTDRSGRPGRGSDGPGEGRTPGAGSPGSEPGAPTGDRDAF